jgi:hypothetical protein
MRTRSALLFALILTTSACGGGNDAPSSSGAQVTDTTAKTGASTGKADGTADFSAAPVMLTVDPCTLVTKAETEALIGPVGDANGATFDPPKCIYVSSAGTGGQLAVSLTEPDLCKLLFLALDTDTFGGVQVRVDDVGDGGMLVTGGGNVQFVVGGGCIEVDGTVDFDTKIDDDTMLRLAKTAAERAT